jgi:polyferredoxin
MSPKRFIILILGLVFLTASASAEEKFFEVRAKKFSYDPNIIKVNKGDLVRIRLISEDVHHGFFLDGYNIQTSAYPGKEGSLEFIANKTGRFSFRCSVTCGDFHPYMIGYLYVGSNNKFFAGLIIVFLCGFGSFLLTIRKKRIDPKFKLFGIIPLDWRFELTKFKSIRNLVKSRWFPFALIVVNLFVFTIILLAAFFGGFGAGNYNFGVMIVWILWWVLLMIFMVPIGGRSWCMICPFPLIGEWIQRGKLVRVGRQKPWGLNKRWPNKLRNLWPLVILFWVATWFSGFFTVRPLATFILLGAIILVAIILHMIYARRSFCIAVCPVSGFQGLYSNFALCEVRVKDKSICKDHTPKTCFTGNEKGYGCPWMEMPFDMNRNTYCGLCMECLKTCPYDNMAVNIRPPAADYFEEKKKTDRLYSRRGTDEAFKALTMIGIMFSFFMAMQGPWGKIKDMVRATTLEGFLSYIGESALVDFLLIPGLFFLFVFMSKKFSRSKEVKLKDVFVNFSYPLVPVGLAVWAAFSLGIIMPNGSYLLHIVSDPFAWGWNLFGTARFPWTPFLTQVMPYLQIFFVTVGLVFSLDLGYKFSQHIYKNLKEAKRGWIPMLVFFLVLHVIFFWLFIG